MYNKFVNSYLFEDVTVKKISKVITLFTVLMCWAINFCYAEASYSQSTLLSLNVKDKTIKEIFSEIEEKSEYIFFYYGEVLDLNRKVSINMKDKTIQVILDELFKSTDVEYLIFDRQITITKKAAVRDAGVLAPQQQSITVTGKVVDADNNPMPGVNVWVKGTTRGVVTDIDGNYSMTVNSGATVLVFSFIGYISREVTVGDTRQINITLEEDFKMMEEVIVIGYGTQKKASTVGAIVQTGSEELQRTGGVVNLGAALTGQLPGVTVVSPLSEPGNDDPEIYIRGKGTWNNAQPLILVDGIERRMNEVDVSEVESVSVLKDASATAVFGVKGAEGVILVTTKRGKAGKPVVSVDANMSTKTISRVAKKLNSYDQFRFRNEVVEYQLNRSSDQRWDSYLPERMLQYYKQPQPNGLQYLFPDVDWADELIKPFPISYRTSINVSGGTEFAKYFGSVTYTFDDDLIKTNADPMNRGYKAQNSYERLNFRTNLDLNMTKTTLFSINLAGWVGAKRNGYGSDFSSANIFRGFTEYSPDQHPTLMPDGSYGYNPDLQTQGRPNPLASANNSGVQTTRHTNLTTDFNLKQNLDFITKGLSAGLTFSYDNTFYTTGGIQDGAQSKRLYISPEAIDILYSVNGSYIDENGNFYVKEGYRLEDYMQGDIFNTADNHDYDWSKGRPLYNAETSSDSRKLMRRTFYQAQVNYGRTFGRHEVGSLALVNREQYAEGSMFPRYREDWVGRVTYNYDNRYFFESNFAYNGSEKFGTGYRFGFFPSVAAGWMLTEESFMKHIDWLNKLKMRYSIGKIGNDSFDAPRWAYQTNWALGTDRTFFGYPARSVSPYYQYFESGVGNPDLHWETAVKQNLGVEIGTFKNRISLNADLFIDRRQDIFLVGNNRSISTYFGQSAASGNIGKTEVKGYELELSLRNTFANALHTFLTLTYTGAFDKVVYMEDPPLLPDYQKKAGFPIGQITTTIDAGYLNNWDAVYSAPGYASGNSTRMPGDYRILDFNGNGNLDGSDAAPYSYPQDRPQNTYGFNLGGEYKGFNLMVQFYGVYNVTRQYSWHVYPFGNTLRTGPVLEEFAYNSWTPNNTDAKYRAMLIYMQGSQNLGSFTYVDGSFLRLKTAEIGYTMKKLKGNVLGVSSVKFFLNGNNLFLWSKMVDDREGRSTSDPVYPLIRRFNLGINVKF